MNDLFITDPRVRAAVQSVPRSAFLRPSMRYLADEDRPIDIGQGQTTSQPSLIAWTLDQLHLKPGARALEVGTGSGYQTALLAKLCSEVYSVDIIEPLVIGAAQALGDFGITNAHLKVADGYEGWPEAAPFDGIVVCAGTPHLPQPLVDQLAPGGRLIIPIGEPDSTWLIIVKKSLTGVITQEKTLAVRFVPLTGPHLPPDAWGFQKHRR